MGNGKSTSVKSVLSGHLAGFGAYLIFGINIIMCREIAQSGFVPPLSLFCFRASGAALLFYLFSLFQPKESFEKRDLVKIFFASMLGLFLTQITFLKAIAITTPLDVAVVATITPIFTMIFAAIFIKEPITVKKVVGVLVSFAGVLYIVLNSVAATSCVAASSTWGIFLTVLNGMFFALYLAIFRPVIVKYSAVNFMKWMFFFSAIVAIPLDLPELISLHYTQFPLKITLLVVSVVFFSSFVAYLLVSLAQKRLRPTLVSLYSYVQPIVATLLSIFLGMDQLTWQKSISIFLVFAGVAIVNGSKTKKGKD